MKYEPIPGICPNCGSRVLEYGHSDSHDDFVVYPFICGDCGHEDDEVYNLEFFGYQSEEDGEAEKIRGKRPENVRLTL